MPDTYLLVPMPPTPNGRMHIGHGGGTYLRSDVAARALRVRGADVHIVSGTDVYENWVVAEAERIGLSADETCALYHRGIDSDLRALGVEMDVWLDPRDPEHLDAYREVHEQALDALRAGGGARLVPERVPFSLTTGRELVGTWIAGRCPYCGASAGGSSCTACSEHFQPEELVDPRSRLDDSPLVWEERQHWFAYPTDVGLLLTDVAGAGLRPHVAEPAGRYLRSREGRIRLSGQGTWGVRSASVPDDAVLANGYYLYAVYCGEVFSRRTGQANPFRAASDVVTVGFFGSDNSTPGLVAPRVLAQGSAGALRAFDWTVVNGMLHFEGQKCSTSKRHGIWLGELLDSGAVSADELRFTLAAAGLDHGTDDLSLRGLVDRTRTLRRWTADVLVPALDGAAGSPAAWSGDIEKALDAQNEALDLHTMDVPAATAVLEGWMTARGTDTGAWLLGLALLAEPILPVLARQVWDSLGLPAGPTVATARQGATVGGSRVVAPCSDVTEDELARYVHRAAA
ncbi:MAG: class I tRNA ligase family protein [Cellulomonas iranensis]|nr:class I tRNA ligase family protein [Cellulomonas iranensis]MBO9568481.1 class I tRNA ligase family protein [Cellulomonas iranensis]